MASASYEPGKKKNKDFDARHHTNYHSAIILRRTTNKTRKQAQKGKEEIEDETSNNTKKDRGTNDSLDEHMITGKYFLHA